MGNGDTPLAGFRMVANGCARRSSEPTLSDCQRE
jgi:hypothetical protein